MIRITTTVTYEFDPTPTTPVIEPPSPNQTRQPKTEKNALFDAVFGGIEEEVAQLQANGAW